MRLHLILATSMLAVLSICTAMAPPFEDPDYTTDFGLEHCRLVPRGSNPYFSLKPGTFLRYEGEDDGEFVELEITVLSQTKNITFKANGETVKAQARVIREMEWIDGSLVEVSHNWYAACSKTSNVYYFGETVDFYENGLIVGHDGSWQAGKHGAQPGLFMPSVATLGSRYYQEIAPGIALDRAKHTATGLTVNTPAGTFKGCLKVKETTPLEPDSVSIKIYAPNVGLIFDDGVWLVEYDIP